MKNGKLVLTGTVDRAGQARLLETEAQKLLDASPAWKAEMPKGVDASPLAVLPVRSELLPAVRSEFARLRGDPTNRPGMLQQTRVDDLYFDPEGRLRFDALCINQAAYLAKTDAAGDRAEDPLRPVLEAILDRLKAFPLPRDVDPKVLSRQQAGKINFRENPARLLQRWANDSAKLDEVLFRDARFDAEGALVFDGLIGDDQERDEAAALLSRPEFGNVYARPDGAPAAERRASVAAMKTFPWGKAYLSALRESFANSPAGDSRCALLRYCRVDRRGLSIRKTADYRSSSRALHFGRSTSARRFSTKAGGCFFRPSPWNTGSLTGSSDCPAPSVNSWRSSRPTRPLTAFDSTT